LHKSHRTTQKRERKREDECGGKKKKRSLERTLEHGDDVAGVDAELAFLFSFVWV
jgi:hypothetical protein